MKESYIKINFEEGGIRIEGQNLSQSDILCAILALMGEFDKESVQPAVELLRKAKRVMAKKEEQKDKK